MAKITILNARFAVSDAVGAPTRLVAYDATAPLKIARPFEREDGGIDVCLMDASPGLLEGDDYRLKWQIESGARVFLTTQGFTRVHPCVRDSAVTQVEPVPSSRMRTQIRVEAGAYFSYLPDPALLYAKARFGANLEATVAAGSTLIFSDSFAAGRIARNERFDFSCFQNSILIKDEQGPLFCNRTRLVPNQINPIQFAVCGDWTHIATLVAVNDGVDSDWLAVSRETVASFCENVSGREREIKSCVSLLPRRTIAVNIFARRAHEIGELIQQLSDQWQILMRENTLPSGTSDTL